MIWVVGPAEMLGLNNLNIVFIVHSAMHSITMMIILLFVCHVSYFKIMIFKVQGINCRIPSSLTSCAYCDGGLGMGVHPNDYNLPSCNGKMLELEILMYYSMSIQLIFIIWMVHLWCIKMYLRYLEQYCLIKCMLWWIY